MIAVGTSDASVGARTLAAGRDVLTVEGGKVRAGALIACGGP